MRPAPSLGLLALLLVSVGCARFDARRSYLEGQKLETEGHLDRAVEAYRVAVRQDPSEEHETAFERARAALVTDQLRAAKRAERAGDFESALEHWKRLQHLRPEDRRIAARARIAELRASGDSDELWEAAQALLELAPGNREVVRVVAELQARVIEDSLAEAWVSLRAGQKERAFLAFERVRRLDPRNPELERIDARRVVSEVLEVRGDEFAADGEWEQAKVAYARAEIEQPRPELAEKRRRLDEEAEVEKKRLAKARLLRGKGRPEEALSEYERLLPPRPDTPLHRELAEVRAEVEAKRRKSAENLLVRGEVEKALLELGRDGKTLKGISSQSRRRALEVLLEEARSASLAGEKARSIDRLKSALELAEPPEQFGALLRSALLELESGARRKAMAEFAHARTMEPRSKLAAVGHEVARELEMRAMLEEGRELSAKDPYRAYRAYLAAAEITPGTPHVESALARLRPRVVRSAVERASALEAEGHLGQAHFLLGRALLLAPEDEEAKAMHTRLLELLREPRPTTAAIEIVDGAVAGTTCEGLEPALRGRLGLYVSRDRKLPFVLAEEETPADLVLRATVQSCEIDVSGGRMQLGFELLAESAPVVALQTRVESPVSASQKGKLRVSGLRDELVTRAAAKLMQSLRAERERMKTWPEARARARLAQGDTEAVARAHAALVPEERGSAGSAALAAELESWLEARVR